MNDNTPRTPPPVSHTNPIPIVGRHRSASLTSSIPALSNSPTSSVQTPSSTFSYRMNGQTRHVRSSSDTSANAGGGGSPTSPMQYLFGASSPIRTTAGSSFPWAASKTASAIEEDDEGPPGGDSAGIFGLGAHTRRGSWGTPIVPTIGGNQVSSDRGVGVLRRLSLSIQRPALSTSPTFPSAPPPSAVSTSPIASRGVPSLGEPRLGRKGRSASLAVPSTGNEGAGKKRGISPMGERLLKGHFDGFI